MGSSLRMIHDDASLAAGLSRDLEASFEHLVLAYQDRLFGFALRLSGRRAEAEDAVQDAFVRAYKALKTYPQEQRRTLQIRPWLYRITLNVVRNRARGQRPTEQLDGQWPSSSQWAPRSNDEPEPLAEAAERRRELAHLLSDLPDRYRSAVVLRHVHGLPYAEIATILDQPVGTTKANVHRGLHLLRHGMQAQRERALA
jgi:RNA polymerase sigma-70 factor, ECF subfamily